MLCAGGAEGGHGGGDQCCRHHCCHWWWSSASTLLYSSGTYLLGGMDDVSSVCDVVTDCHHRGRQRGRGRTWRIFEVQIVITALQIFSKSCPRTFGTTFVVTTNVHYHKRKEELDAVPLSFCGTIVVVIDDGHDSLLCRYY